ncbi:sodium/hydrogen exchanger 4 isoform X2 [Beta vulgaris subsp. vulgaris]|uniref:sodium/hydrogen exchanger 4 isoform X2 n=1 Tax=Beta vulgaris subsp. vulgaris TaxID=3555 RepID=UPI00203721F2|nr:sodium/hydrogen exchanger 4 isoform X2 [Beta vulgaris subsp. vulgaris]
MVLDLGVQIANMGESGHAQVVPIAVFVAVLCFCMVIGHLLEENRWVNESITAILIGCLTGMIILLISKGKNSHIVRFDEELFFIYLLPPIIFNAGFQVKKKQFFQNFLTIMLFGVIGVFISTTIISTGSWWLFPKVGFAGLTARDYLAIGTIFSSTDTVCTLQTGLLTAYALKALYFGRHSTDREIALMTLMAYLSYMLAELSQLSGILTVFFCGIVMSHYAWHNITENSRITTRHIFATMSFIAETFIFLYVGTDVFDMEKWKMTKMGFGTLVGIYTTVVFLILLGRAAFVFPLSAISNRMNREKENSGRRSTITFRKQVIIWWAGLMRGAVSIALAFKQFTYSGITMDTVNATMVTTTVIVVLFTTLVFGFLTKPLILYLVPHTPTQETKSPKDDLTLPMLSMDESAATNLSRAKDSLSMLIERPVHTIHSYWRKFDDAYMRPLFGGPVDSQRR